jgi:F0F1-type ATP synthase assembly protein I
VADDGPSAAKYAGIGLQFAISIIVFLFAGQWLDRKFGTSPIFLMLGVFVGAGAAFYSMYRKLMSDQDAEDKTHRR